MDLPESPTREFQGFGMDQWASRKLFLNVALKLGQLDSVVVIILDTVEYLPAKPDEFTNGGFLRPPTFRLLRTSRRTTSA